MTSSKESADMVFERINRRRAGLAQAIESGPDRDRPADGVAAPPMPPVPVVSATVTAGAGAAESTAPPLRADEVLFDNSGVASSGAAHPDAPHGSFPRSATMRLILKHPALALCVGVPAAALLLRSQASRRLLRLALQISGRPELHNLMDLSVAAARLARPARTLHNVPPPAL